MLIVGLGNPGEKYASTRHNVGFMVVDRFVGHHPWESVNKFQAEICKINNEITVLKPQTYMNHSGIAVATYANFYKIPAADIWVVHDDIDLPLGKIRIRAGGASAGHNGVISLIESLGSEAFVRFRLGIGKGKLERKKTSDRNMHRREIERFVVSDFGEHEAHSARKMVKHAVDALHIAFEKGIEKAMLAYN